MKYVGSRPQEAEKRAIEAIERLIEKREFRKHEVMPPVDIAPVDPEQAPAPKGTTAHVSIRKLLAAAVRFGHSRPSQDAITANVSERGMFVSTSSPLDAGAAISFMRTTTAGGADATNAAFPLEDSNEGYLYPPKDGTWTVVSFLAPNLTASLNIIEAREKEEGLL